MENQNGRVNLHGPSAIAQFSLYDQIPVNEPSSAYNSLAGNWIKTELSNLFFSMENVERLQAGIINGVKHKSHGKFNIGKQNYDTLNVIMRSIFLQKSKNRCSNLSQQVLDLNDEVLNYCIPQIYGEVIGYINYTKDISTLHTPMENPYATRENKTLEMKKWF